MNILNDIQNEVELFFNGLNWTYIMIYSFVVYGIKYKEEFEWYNKLFENPKIKPFKIWISGLIIALLFSFFKYLEDGMEVSYISTLLRSWIIVIIFNSIFSEKIKKIK